MYHIAESIEICSPPEKVFSVIKDAETRMRLNPSCTVIACEKLNSPEIAGGERFRFILQAKGKRFKCDVVEVVKKNRIISKAVDGSCCVTLSVKRTAAGTSLLHEEDFVLPDEVLEPQLETSHSHPFEVFRRVLRVFYGFDYYQAEKARKADEIIASMRAALQSWLMSIREKMEIAAQKGDAA